MRGSTPGMCLRMFWAASISRVLRLLSAAAGKGGGGGGSAVVGEGDGRTLSCAELKRRIRSCRLERSGILKWHDVEGEGKGRRESRSGGVRSGRRSRLPGSFRVCRARTSAMASQGHSSVSKEGDRRPVSIKLVLDELQESGADAMVDLAAAAVGRRRQATSTDKMSLGRVVMAGKTWRRASPG